MTTLQHIVSIALLGIGALVALVNVGVLARQVRGRRSPSVTPFIGGIFLFVGALLFPGGALRPWAAIGLFVDYGCMPYLIGASVCMACETRRYSAKNRILSLAYDAKECSGEFHLFPQHECIHEWRAKDGMSRGSMIMRLETFVPDARLELSLEEIRITMASEDGDWVLCSESGWHDQVHSLEGSVIAEVTANKSLQRTALRARR